MANNMITCPNCRHKFFEQQTYESSSILLGDQPQILHSQKSGGFWASDGPTFALAGFYVGLCVWCLCWLLEANYVWSALSALLVGGGLHVVKLLLYRPTPPPAPPAKSQEFSIKAEFTDTASGRVFLDELNFHSGVRFPSLRRVCLYLLDHNFQWAGRPTLCRKASISQGQYTLIKAELERLNYLVDNDGVLVCSWRGRSFCRSCSALSEF